MPYVADRSTVGFEFLYNKSGFAGNPVPYELLPNTAFTKGMLVGMPVPGAANAGKLVPLTSAATVATHMVIGVMAESILAADNPAAGLTYGLVLDHPDNVYRVSFTPALNAGAPPAGAGTTTTLDTGIDDDIANASRGALLYMYSGPGAGCVRTITATDGNGVLTWIKPIAVATSVLTKFFVLAPATLDGIGVNVGTIGLAVDDHSTGVLANVSPVPATGLLNVLAIDPKNLWMDVTIRAIAHFSRM